MGKRKIIFIITFNTKPSEYENQPRPKFCWTRPDGKMIGIWGLEWGEILMKALVDNYPEYECEVWKPELGADKVYSAQMQDRLVSRKFPAVIHKTFKRYKFFPEIYSENMVDIVDDYDSGNTVFMLPVTVYNKLLKNIIKRIKKSNVLFYNLLNMNTMLPINIQNLNPLKALNVILINNKKLRRLRGMQAIISGYNNSSAMSWLLGYNPRLRIYELKWGMDLDFWRPAITRNEARAKLGIDPYSFVILLSQRLVPEYQVDKFLEAIDGVPGKRSFECYITGHGTKEYEAYLQNLARGKGLEDSVHFLGFVDDEALRDYLIAADIFATFATKSAGSGGALKASAVGIPVLLTNTTGGTYEFLKNNGVGAYVDPYDYDGWRDTLERIINGDEVKPMPRTVMEQSFSWKNTADCIHKAITHWDQI